jgi:hypothetical protein
MRFSFLLLTLFVFGAVTVSRADSPLTSTDFSSAYESEAILAVAAQASGTLTEELMDYLASDANPIDVKMAVISRLSWAIDGKKNAVAYWNYLSKKRRYGSEKVFKKKGKGHELLCMAYLKALDNYFDVTQAVEYAALAEKKEPKSYTFRLIAALIRAQKAFDDSWCQVYRLTDDVRSNTALKMDMKPEASQLIFDYMDIYSEYCEN